MSGKTILSITGVLGVGKTTFIKHLQQMYPSATYIAEPVDQWMNLRDQVTGENLLDRFYKDMKRYSYSFENVAFITRLNLLIDALDRQDSTTIVLDGSLATDRNVYAQMLHDDGMMDSLEWSAYNLWSHFYEQHVRQNKIYYLYLRCDPKIIMERVGKRGRPEEKNLDIKYLIKLQSYLDRWAEEKKGEILIYDFSCEEGSPPYNQILTDISQLLGGAKLPQTPVV